MPIKEECKRSVIYGGSRKVYAKAIKDYKSNWLDYTIPEGTIVQIELYPHAPDFLFLDDGSSYAVYNTAIYFEVLE